MRLEKREVTLNEKDALLDMIFFEQSLAGVYRRAARGAERKEERGLFLLHADSAAEKIRRLRVYLERSPKM